LSTASITQHKTHKTYIEWEWQYKKQMLFITKNVGRRAGMDSERY